MSGTNTRYMLYTTDDRTDPVIDRVGAYSSLPTAEELEPAREGGLFRHRRLHAVDERDQHVHEWLPEERRWERKR